MSEELENGLPNALDPMEPALLIHNLVGLRQLMDIERGSNWQGRCHFLNQVIRTVKHLSAPDAGKAEPDGALGWDQTPVEATWSDGAVHSYVDLKAALAWQSRQWIVDLGTRIVSVRPLFAHPQPPQPSPGVGEAVETVARAIDPDAFEWLDDVRSRGDEGRMTHASWAPIRKAESAAARVLAALSSARVEAEEERDQSAQELDKVSAALGGDCRFMDPPDGGDVSLSEQVRRMRSALDEAEARIANLEAERKADGAKGWPVHICEVRNASDFEQERAAVRASQTYRSGDVVRVWACEGDIFANPNVKLEVIDAAHQKGGE